MSLDTLFRFSEGMIGTVDDCQVFVFRYVDKGKSAKAFKHATTRLNNNPKFINRNQHATRYSMVGRQKELVLVSQTGRYIAIVIGHDQDKVKSTSNRLIEELKGG